MSFGFPIHFNTEPNLSCGVGVSLISCKVLIRIIFVVGTSKILS